MENVHLTPAAAGWTDVADIVVVDAETAVAAAVGFVDAVVVNEQPPLVVLHQMWCWPLLLTAFDIHDSANCCSKRIKIRQTLLIVLHNSTIESIKHIGI